MPQTISQNLNVPAGLEEGGVASSTQIIPLYNSLNNFLVPDSIGGFQVALSDASLHTVTTGNSFDWSVSVPANKAVFAFIPFRWSGAASGTLALRVNGVAVGSAVPVGAVATGNGIAMVFIGGHDATDELRPVMHLQVDSVAATLRVAQPNADLTASDTTTIGFNVAVASVSFNFKYALFMREG